MNDKLIMNDIFESFFLEKTVRFPSFILTKVDDTSLEKFRTVINKVKDKTKSTAIKMEYDVMSKQLIITGTSVDIYWFGYYTCELK